MPNNVIGSLAGAAGIGRGLWDVAVSLQHGDLKLKIAELNRLLAEAIDQATALTKENATIRNQLEEVLLKQRPEDQVVFREGHYYAKEPEPGKPPGPFCPRCLSDKGKLVPLAAAPMFLQVDDYAWACPVCNGAFR